MTGPAPDPAGGAAGDTVHAEPLVAVRIPGSADHGGTHRIKVRLRWVCPTCGGPRGAVHPAISFDGSRRLACDGWTNPCGHIDYYQAVRREAGR